MKHIKILGTGCPKCRQLAENARAAAERIGLDCTIDKVTDIGEIMKHGVMLTPGIVVDDQVKGCGKVLPVERIISILQEG